MGKVGILDDYMKCWQKLRSRKTGTVSIEIFSGEPHGMGTEDIMLEEDSSQKGTFASPVIFRPTQREKTVLIATGQGWGIEKGYGERLF